MKRELWKNQYYSCKETPIIDIEGVNDGCEERLDNIVCVETCLFWVQLLQCATLSINVDGCIEGDDHVCSNIW